MKFILIGLLVSSFAYADEFCETELGFKKYAIESEDGALAASDASKFKLTYWENNKKEIVPDASFEILKIVFFHEESKPAGNGTGDHWISQAKDYAVRIRVTTTDTVLYPGAMGNPRPIKEMTVSTMCRSLVSIRR